MSVSRFEELGEMYPGRRLKLRAEVWDWIDEQGGKAFLRKLIYRLFTQENSKRIVAERRRSDAEHFEKPGIAHPPRAPRTARAAPGAATEAARNRAEDDGVNYEEKDG